jgi:hypothetical protein
LAAKADLCRDRDHLNSAEQAVENAKVEELKKDEARSKPTLTMMLSTAFEVTPEQERERRAKKVMKRQKVVLEHTFDIAAKKQALLKKIEERDSAIHSATIAIETAEYDRISQTHACLRKYVENERASLKFKSQLLGKLEEALDAADVKGDITTFVNQNQDAEETHKYHKALSILDWDYRRRKAEAKAFTQNRRRMSEDVVVLGDFEKEHTPAVRLSDVGMFDMLESYEGNKGVINLDSEFFSLGVLNGMDSAQREFSFLEKPGLVGLAKSACFDSSDKCQCSPIDRSDGSNGHGQAADTTGRDAIVGVVGNEGKGVAAERRKTKSAGARRDVQSMASVFALSTTDSLTSTRAEQNGKSVRYELSPSSEEVSSTTMQSQLAILFGNSDDDIAKTFDGTENPWSDILFAKKARDLFLQELDKNRGSHGKLSHVAFGELTLAMKAMLDYCEQNEEVRAAMRVANMANTYHTCPKLPEETRNGEGEKISLDLVEKHYIQQESMIRNHCLWRQEAFWDAALIQGVAEELEHRDAILWDELSPEEMREEVIGVHNVVFGQLATMTITMHAIGLNRWEVLRKLLRLSRGAQLTVEQENDLVVCVENAFAGEPEDLEEGFRPRDQTTSESTEELSFSGRDDGGREARFGSSNTEGNMHYSGGDVDPTSLMAKSLPLNFSDLSLSNQCMGKSIEDLETMEGMKSGSNSRRPSAFAMRLGQSPVEPERTKEIMDTLTPPLESPRYVGVDDRSDRELHMRHGPTATCQPPVSGLANSSVTSFMLSPVYPLGDLASSAPEISAVKKAKESQSMKVTSSGPEGIGQQKSLGFSLFPSLGSIDDGDESDDDDGCWQTTPFSGSQSPQSPVLISPPRSPKVAIPPLKFDAQNELVNSDTNT